MYMYLYVIKACMNTCKRGNETFAIKLGKIIQHSFKRMSVSLVVLPVLTVLISVWKG